MQLNNSRLNGNLGRILEVLLKKPEGEQAYDFTFPALPTGFSQVCGKLQK